jgi:hypothetical protein
MRVATHLLAPAALLAAASVAAPAAAAAPWSAPVTISAPHTFVDPLQITVAGTTNVAWWRWRDGVGEDAAVGASMAARPAGAAAFGPERSLAKLPADLFDVQGYGDGRLLALSQVVERRASRRGPVIYRVKVADGTTSGFQTPRTVARDIVNSRAQLAVAPNGRGLVGYLARVPKTNRVLVRVALRSTNGSISKPEVISDVGQAETIAVAASRRGDLVVAFVRDKRVLARVKRPGHGWGRVQTLATPDGPTQWALRAGVGDHGEVEVLWRRRRLTQTGRPGVRSLQASRLSATGSRFGKVSTIEADGASPPSPLVATADGFAFGYTMRLTIPGSRPLPRVGLLDTGGATAISIAPASGGLRDVRVAFSQRFGLLATMVQPTANGNSDGIGLGAFLAPGATSFGPVEAVTPAENVHEIAPAFDRDGAPIAVWSARPEGTGPSIPIDQIRSVVRTATRAG